MSAELRNSKPIQDIGTLTAGSSCVAMIFSPILPTEPSSEKPTSWMGTSYHLLSCCGMVKTHSAAGRMLLMNLANYNEVARAMVSERTRATLQ